MNCWRRCRTDRAEPSPSLSARHSSSALASDATSDGVARLLSHHRAAGTARVAKPAYPLSNCLFGVAMASLIIRGGTVVNHDHSRRADVLIDGETIVAVGSAIDAPARATVADAVGGEVMPGGVDAHTQLELNVMGSVAADELGWVNKA